MTPAIEPDGCHWRHHDQGGTASAALFSDCGAYRYFLSRRWAEGPGQLWIMLNPSTADETKNDPTIARCERRARLAGFGALGIGNLHGFRATHPRDLKAATDPDGPANAAVLDWAVRAWLGRRGQIVCAWGRHGTAAGAALAARLAPQPLHVLGCNGDGSPRHPLYIALAVAPALWHGA